MAATVLPESPDAFKDATWRDVLPYYEELSARPLDAANVEDWLAEWSRFESLLSEAYALATFAYSCDTANSEKEAAQLRFGTQISPKAQEQRVRLQKRLVELGYMSNKDDLKEYEMPLTAMGGVHAGWVSEVTLADQVSRQDKAASDNE